MWYIYSISIIYVLDHNSTYERNGCLPLGASTVAALVLVLIGQALQPGWHFLLRLHKDVQQVLCDVAVLIIVEGGG